MYLNNYKELKCLLYTYFNSNVFEFMIEQILITEKKCDILNLFDPSVSCSKLNLKVNQNMESGTAKKNACMYVVFDQNRW